MRAASPSLEGRENVLPSMPRSRADEQRQEAIAKAHLADVWRFLRAVGVPPEAVDDATQEVFLVLARKLENVQHGAEKAFLFSTAVNVSRELRRKHTREELAEDPDDERLEPALLSTPEDSFGRKEEHGLLMRLLEGLDDDLRTPFVLFEIEGQSVNEIAAVLGAPVGTIASRLRRAREKFEVRLQRLQMKMRGGR
ncbi:MAG: polymerase sigma factor RpoE [Labilithrix sp.]|nr:polymerase sigma factor RpoE [Labilithrix sp.]